MSDITTKNLLEARVHFGHMAKKWNPKMSKFILMKKNDLHIIDLNKTVACLNAACNYMKELALAGKRIMFVGTKEQAKSIISMEASKVGMPYVTERWLGGTLTNFIALKRLIKKWQSFEKMIASPTYKNLTKKEQLTILREKDKLSTLLSGLGEVSRLPSAMFVVDVKKEHIAVREAISLGIPVIAIVDTNVNPDLVDLPIPANDDSVSSIEIIVKTVANAIEEGLKERSVIKQKEISTKESAPKLTISADGSETSNSDIPVEKKQVQSKATRITTGSNKTTSTASKANDAGKKVPTEEKPKVETRERVSKPKVEKAESLVEKNESISGVETNKVSVKETKDSEEKKTPKVVEKPKVEKEKTKA